MKMRSVVAAAIIAFVVLLVQTAAADAGEVKLLSVVALGPALNELVPQFERATGHKLAIQYVRHPQEASKCRDECQVEQLGLHTFLL